MAPNMHLPGLQRPQMQSTRRNSLRVPAGRIKPKPQNPFCQPSYQAPRNLHKKGLTQTERDPERTQLAPPTQSFYPSCPQLYPIFDMRVYSDNFFCSFKELQIFTFTFTFTLLMILMYRIINDDLNIDRELLFPDTRGHHLKIDLGKPAHVDVRRNFFSQTVIIPWNELPQHVAESCSIDSFKFNYDKWLIEHKRNIITLNIKAFNIPILIC